MYMPPENEKLLAQVLEEIDTVELAVADAAEPVEEVAPAVPAAVEAVDEVVPTVIPEVEEPVAADAADPKS
jgi:hypothetical protein